MKKQFHKIKIAAENLSRSNKSENKNDELVKIEKQVEKYKEVLEKIHKKFSPSVNTDQDKEKRLKKIHEYKLGQALEESAKDLPNDLVLHQVLTKGGDVEKCIASCIVDNEIYIENEVTKKLKSILDNDIQEITAQRRNVSRYLQEYNSIKRAYENAQRSNENNTKISQLKLDQEECELKLEKERDLYAAQMFELIAKDEVIAYSIRDFIVNQKLFYEKALNNLQKNLKDINNIVDTCKKKKVFGVSLQEHLKSTNREISFVIELCVCCLIERGLYEEGLLRVGCGGTKLKRMKNAIDAQYVNPPLPPEYQDIHVIASLLKSYLRELPEPLLTYELYNDFIQAAQYQNDDERKCAILNSINKLPKDNYNNLKYLTKFLWNLYQHHEQNKMSSQNIAIVISPNILWPPENNSNSKDYVGQVNSSAAVNTIVELLVSQWDYFFNGEIEFFINFSRDTLFIDTTATSTSTTPQHSIIYHNNHIINNNNNNNNINTNSILMNSANNYNSERDNIGGNSLTETTTISQQQQQQHQHQHQTINSQTHSRSSSHDTSRILLGASDGCLVGRSHSNDSLSDNSSPTYTDSPKLPARRKHNKPSAPTPPHKMNIGNNGFYENQSINTTTTTTTVPITYTTTTTTNEQSKTENNDNNHNNSNVHVQTLQKCDNFSQTPPLTITTTTTTSSSSDKNAIKPEKPPRPAAPVDCFTLNRTTYKNRSIEKIPSSNSTKPVALPRTILNVAKSTENLSTTTDDVQLRDKPEIKEKPAIPERPVTLMRPTSFRSDGQFHQELTKFVENNNGNTNSNGNAISSLKKASSFRISTPLSQNSNKFLNNNLANSTSSLCTTATTTTAAMNNSNTTSSNNQMSGVGVGGGHNNKTTLERAQIYSVDKKQVAIIDVVTTAETTLGTPTVAITTNNSINSKSFISASPRSDNRTTFADSAMSSSREFILTESNYPVGIMSTTATTTGSSTTTTPSHEKVPPSPRGFDGNKMVIKRPQIPAPPPPTNRRRSADGGLGDSTHL